MTNVVFETRYIYSLGNIIPSNQLYLSVLSLFAFINDEDISHSVPDILLRSVTKPALQGCSHDDNKATTTRQRPNNNQTTSLLVVARCARLSRVRNPCSGIVMATVSDFQAQGHWVVVNSVKGRVMEQAGGCGYPHKFSILHRLVGNSVSSWEVARIANSALHPLSIRPLHPKKENVQ